MQKHRIRIVGGQFKRTPIPVIDAPGLRPTPDRVRETLFNWLNHLWDESWQDKQVLDLFAGTGALGLEAASRGAGHVLMIENHRAAAAALRGLRDKLGATNLRIHQGDAWQVLERLDATRYDLVLLDPPFGLGLLERIWPALPGILNPGAYVYAESESAIELPENSTVIRSGKAGAVHYYLLQFAAPQ